VGHYEFENSRSESFVLSRIDLKGNVIWGLSQNELGGLPTKTLL